MSKKQLAWDDESNEAKNDFVGFNEIGDFVLGTLIDRKKVKSTLPDKNGEMQNIYVVKVRQSRYHLLDEKKRIIEEAVEPNEGDIVSVGGRKIIDSRMDKVKIGQVFGLKFKEELPAKQKGYNPTKLITVYTPKDENGEYEMDTEWLESNKDPLDDFDAQP